MNRLIDFKTRLGSMNLLPNPSSVDRNPTDRLTHGVTHVGRWPLHLAIALGQGLAGCLWLGGLVGAVGTIAQAADTATPNPTIAAPSPQPVTPAAKPTAMPAAMPTGTPTAIPNPAIDYEGFLTNAAAVAELRRSRRISEADFMAMAQDPDTIILDARSQEKFDRRHIAGAKHLSLPDITAEELAKIIPEKTTRILIYCNNNFENEPIAFPTKMATASLNIYTFNTLYSYGYENVYELGPLLDIERSQLPFAGSEVQKTPQATP